MPVPVNTGVEIAETVIEMHAFQSIETDSVLDLFCQRLHARLSADIIPRGKTVAGIVADADAGRIGEFEMTSWTCSSYSRYRLFPRLCSQEDRRLGRMKFHCHVQCS